MILQDIYIQNITSYHQGYINDILVTLIGEYHIPSKQNVQPNGKVYDKLEYISEISKDKSTFVFLENIEYHNKLKKDNVILYDPRRNILGDNQQNNLYLTKLNLDQLQYYIQKAYEFLLNDEYKQPNEHTKEDHDVLMYYYQNNIANVYELLNKNDANTLQKQLQILWANILDYFILRYITNFNFKYKNVVILIGVYHAHNLHQYLIKPKYAQAKNNFVNIRGSVNLLPDKTQTNPIFISEDNPFDEKLSDRENINLYKLIFTKRLKQKYQNISQKSIDTIITKYPLDFIQGRKSTVKYIKPTNQTLKPRMPRRRRKRNLV